jgi:hypothetical protein
MSRPTLPAAASASRTGAIDLLAEQSAPYQSQYQEPAPGPGARSTAVFGGSVPRHSRQDGYGDDRLGRCSRQPGKCKPAASREP